MNCPLGAEGDTAGDGGVDAEERRWQPCRVLMEQDQQDKDHLLEKEGVFA
jgi:hypothetical protein